MVLRWWVEAESPTQEKETLEQGSKALCSSKHFYMAFGLMENQHEFWSSQQSHCHYGRCQTASKGTSVKTGEEGWGSATALLWAHSKAQ